jgi:hypothetical protein
MRFAKDANSTPFTAFIPLHFPPCFFVVTPSHRLLTLTPAFGSLPLPATAKDDAFRKIVIRPKRPGLTVRSKAGYFSRQKSANLGRTTSMGLTRLGHGQATVFVVTFWRCMNASCV